MSQVKELLIEELQDLLHAETQLVNAIPKMAQAAKAEKLREAFEKHLAQTQVHAKRLQQVLEMLGGDSEPTPCRAMMGLIEEGQERIDEADSKEEIPADLSIITAAQKIEHYEIAGYGTAATLAREIGELDVVRLLERTLGEEESTDHMLTMISKPLLQQARMEDLTSGQSSRKTSRSPKTRHA